MLRNIWSEPFVTEGGGDGKTRLPRGKRLSQGHNISQMLEVGSLIDSSFFLLLIHFTEI